MDYVQAFTQETIEKELFLKVPACFQVGDGDNDDYSIKQHINIHGKNQSGRFCYKYLTKNLTKEIVFTKSDIDECVFFRGSFMYILYTDDSIIAGPNQEKFDTLVEGLNKKNLVVTV